jgi:hypothetical protein
MAVITFDPVPPFRAREACLGHAFDYATMWLVVDAEGHTPWSLIKDRDPETIIDEAYCRAAADRLNAECEPLTVAPPA